MRQRWVWSRYWRSRVLAEAERQQAAEQRAAVLRILDQGTAPAPVHGGRP